MAGIAPSNRQLRFGGLCLLALCVWGQEDQRRPVLQGKISDLTAEISQSQDPELLVLSLSYRLRVSNISRVAVELPGSSEALAARGWDLEDGKGKFRALMSPGLMVLFPEQDFPECRELRPGDRRDFDVKADSSIFFPGQLTKLKAEETIRLYFEPICRSKAHPDPFHRAGAVRITTVHAAPVRVRIPPVPAPAKVVPRDARR